MRPDSISRPQNRIRTKRIWAQGRLYYLFAFLQSQRLSDVGDVIKRLQLRHARAQHHGKQVDEEVSVLTDGQVRFIAHLLEPGGRQQKEMWEREKNRSLEMQGRDLHIHMTKITTAEIGAMTPNIRRPRHHVMVSLKIDSILKLV